MKQKCIVILDTWVVVQSWIKTDRYYFQKAESLKKCFLDVYVEHEKPPLMSFMNLCTIKLKLLN